MCLQKRSTSKVSSVKEALTIFPLFQVIFRDVQRAGGISVKVHKGRRKFAVTPKFRDTQPQSIFAEHFSDISLNLLARANSDSIPSRTMLILGSCIYSISPTC